jgi:hypothetical protein
MGLAPVEIDDGHTVWRFDPGFLRSTWTCLWGNGCLGILDHAAPELGQGCCSVGAELDDGDEAMTIGALAATPLTASSSTPRRPPGASTPTTPAGPPGWSTAPASS